ncbi:MAG: mycoredoxin [Candidatus Nanopelagicales bacterium]
MYTTAWCGYCVRLKSQMLRAGVEFDEVDIEQNPSAADFVGSVNGGNHVVPTVVLADGRAMTNPSIHQLLAEVG